MLPPLKAACPVSPKLKKKEKKRKRKKRRRGGPSFLKKLASWRGGSKAGSRSDLKSHP